MIYCTKYSIEEYMSKRRMQIYGIEMEGRFQTRYKDSVIVASFGIIAVNNK